MGLLVPKTYARKGQMSRRARRGQRRLVIPSKLVTTTPCGSSAPCSSGWLERGPSALSACLAKGMTFCGGILRASGPRSGQRAHVFGTNRPMTTMMKQRAYDAMRRAILMATLVAGGALAMAGPALSGRSSTLRDFFRLSSGWAAMCNLLKCNRLCVSVGSFSGISPCSVQCASTSSLSGGEYYMLPLAIHL